MIGKQRIKPLVHGKIERLLILNADGKPADGLFYFDKKVSVYQDHAVLKCSMIVSMLDACTKGQSTGKNRTPSVDLSASRQPACTEDVCPKL